MPGQGLISADHALLLRLLRIPTAGPLESGTTSGSRVALRRAQREYATAAAAVGFDVVRNGPAGLTDVNREGVPLIVWEAARNPEFLAVQPSLVLRLGPWLPTSRTVMFNVHLDTVAGDGTRPGFDGVRFTGRGAIDAKGQAVALLAGIRAARARDRAIGSTVSVLIQAVSGEEGGAMGTIGTRPLVRAGYYGRLNIFCEPTGLRYLTRASAAMTACVRVNGSDAIDDHPESGHNASVLLGFLAQYFASAATVSNLPEPGHRPCIAGLRTGDAHNRVYGTGELLMNLSYTSPGAASELERWVNATLSAGLVEFRRRFAESRLIARTAQDAPSITSLHWSKRGLPSLHHGDAWGEAILTAAGVPRLPDHDPAFTCDAIWMSGVPDTCTAVLGAGSLEDNNAHACGEYADVDELDSFAESVASIVTTFARSSTTKELTLS